MNHTDADLFDLFPELTVFPVLSVSKDCVLPQELMVQLSIETLPETSSGNLSPSSAFSPELKHVICADKELCAKKKSINLFVFAFQLLQRSSTGSCLWLHANDNSQATRSSLTIDAVTLAETIQLYLSQAGFLIDAAHSPLKITRDFNLFATRDAEGVPESSLKLVG